MRLLMALLSVIGPALMFAASVSPEDATSRLTAWVKWLGLDAIPSWLRAVVGIGLLAWAVPYWTAFYLRWRKARSDHWAERNQLEISVIANVSAGRESTAMPIDSDPENSRLRELKDSIEQGILDATLNEGKLDMLAKVTLGAFRDYIAVSPKPYWIKVIKRWEARQIKAAESASTFSASLSVRDALALAPQEAADIEALSKAIRQVDTTSLRVLSERGLPLSVVNIETPLDRRVIGILIQAEIADREIAEQRAHEKDLAKSQARGPMRAQVVKAVVWVIVGGILALGGQQVL